MQALGPRSFCPHPSNSSGFCTPLQANIEPGCSAFYSIFALKPGNEILSPGARAHRNLDAVPGRQDASVEAGPAHLTEPSPRLRLQLSGGGELAPYHTLLGLPGWWNKQRCPRTASLKELKDWSEKFSIVAGESGSRKWVRVEVKMEFFEGLEKAERPSRLGGSGRLYGGDW